MSKPRGGSKKVGTETPAIAPVQKPRLTDFAVAGGRVKAKTVKSQRDKFDPSAENMESLNRDILSIWTDDVTDMLGAARMDKLGTAIPYIFNIAGDLLVNPSTVSPSTFKKMVECDYTLYPALLNTINGVINTIGNYIHENPDIQHHIRRAIKLNKRGWRTMLRDILTGVHAGFSRQEKIWDWCPELKADIIVDTQPLPQNSLVFRVDAYGELQEDGVGQYVFNSFFPGFSSLLSYGLGNVFAPLMGSGAANYLPGANGPGAGQQYNTGPDPYASTGDLDTPYRTWTISPIGLIWMPTDKTIGYEYYGVTNNKNPYGKSICRAAYNLYVFKYGVLQFLGEALDKKSAPLLVGYARPDVPTGSMNPSNPAQSLVPQPFQVGAPIQDAVTYLAQALAQTKGSSALALAGMKGEIFDIESVDIQGELGIFIDTLKYVDECILMSVMTPKTTFGSDGKGSYALSYSQSDVQTAFRMTLRKDLLEGPILDQYIQPMIEEAFTEAEHKNNFGSFDVERTSIDEQVKLSGIYAEQIETGVIDITNIDDLNRVRENLGFNKVETVPPHLKALVQAMIAKGAQLTTGSSGAAPAKKPKQKREKLDNTEKPYAHHQGK